MEQDLHLYVKRISSAQPSHFSETFMFSDADPLSISDDAERTALPDFFTGC